MKYVLLFIIVCCPFAKTYTQELSLQLSVVDFERIEAVVAVLPASKEIKGSIKVDFTMLKNASSVYLDAKGMTGENSANSNPLDILFTEDKVIIQGDLKKGERYAVAFSYRVKPKQAMYFVDNQIWTQGQGKYTSHWLPSIDDMNDKIIFDLLINDIGSTSVIVNGLSKEQLDFSGRNGLLSRMKNPISSYLVALVAGDYQKIDDTAASGIPLEYYYYPEDSIKVESTYRYSKQIFDFLETEIGVPFPWQVYKQVPVKDFLYAGMENASLTVFSDNFIVDDIGFTDRNYVNVNAHELAHQWFGDLVTETKSEHHWLHEGFATYYALLAEREIFGDDYFYFKLFETAEQLRELSNVGKGQRLVAAGGSSLTYYQKGAWALHILQEKIGKDAFTKAVKNYLTTHAYQNVTTDDFMAAVQAVTTVDLTDFKKNWLYQSAFQAEDALEALKKSDFMQTYFQLQSGRAVPLSSKFTQLIAAIETGNDYLGQEAVYQLSEESINAVLPAFKKAIASDNIFIRQAIATSLEVVPEELVLDFYDLLKDPSYLTQEQAFIKLWFYHQQRNDSKSQRHVLNLMDSTFGFADGNIRTLWLALSLATPAYKPEQSLGRYQELIAYSSPKQPYQLRENAFNYLRQLDSFEKESLRSLVEGSVHHVWRFRESARKLLEDQLKLPKTKALLKTLSIEFSEKEMTYLKKIGAIN